MKMPLRVVSFQGIKEKLTFTEIGIIVAQAIHVNIYKYPEHPFQPTYSGLYIKKVEESSIAQWCNIYRGDRLLRVNDFDVSCVYTLVEFLHFVSSLDSINSLTVVRMTPIELAFLPLLEDMDCKNNT